MNAKPGLTYAGWDDIEQMVDHLAEKIQASSKQYEVIAGVTRGGLIPAVMLSHKLNLPMIAIAPTDIVENDHVTLIVDEIYDTGKTVKEIRFWNPRSDIAVLFHNEGLPELEYYVIKRKLDDWIVFPWEKKDD